MSKGNPRIYVRLDRSTMEEIKAQAASEGLSAAEFVRFIIYAYLEVHK